MAFSPAAKLRAHETLLLGENDQQPAFDLYLSVENFPQPQAISTVWISKDSACAQYSQATTRLRVS